MDELIWKHIDNSCTKEEAELVEKLLETDPAFKRSYDLLVDLEHQLSSVDIIPMKESYKVHLANVMYDKLSEKNKVTEIDVLPIHWIIGLSVVAVAAIIYAVSLSENSASILSFIPTFDGKIVSMVGWVSTGFIMLTLLDIFLKKLHIARKTFLMV